MYATIDASSNNIGTTYGTGAGSLIIDGAPTGGHLGIISTVAKDIVYSITTKPTGSPDDSTTTNPHQWLLPAAPSGGTSANTQDFLIVNKGDRIFIKSPNGTASSGKVTVIIW